MPKTLIKLATVAAFSLFASYAMAQAPAAGTAGTGGTKPAAAGMAGTGDSKAAAAPMTMGKTRTAKSLECSKEADAKGLHGKARKKFRSACKAGKTPAM